jgi:hypothetical protein
MQTEIDDDLMILVVNQCLALVLRDCLGDQALDADDIKFVEYYPVWTLDRGTGGKKLLRIMARLSHKDQFQELDPRCFLPAGFTIDELYEFFEKSEAKKV